MDRYVEKKIDDLLGKMTLAEKAGQLNQLRGVQYVEANESERNDDLEEEVRAGRVGSFLNVPYEDKIRYQKIAVEESPNGIPLVFAMDVIHGYRTIFPNPLGEAASWDTELMEKSARIAAVEAAADGYMWTFAPMVDVASDARWGRVMEGAGEDPLLGCRAARARVLGFQGGDLSRPDTIMACAKHFAAYGQSMAGRDYNQTVISRRFLHDYVLPPFEAACEAGAATFMNAFNDFDGIPCSGNSYLVTDILKKRWGFEGFTVSDWESFKEMINWGYAEDLKDAAEKAISAGSDVDMISYAYIDHLAELVEEGRVPESVVDDSVRRLLRMKFALGLFDDPFRYFSDERRAVSLLTPENRAAAREGAEKSMVLLKNDGDILPLKQEDHTSIAVIGPIELDRVNYLGAWPGMGRSEEVVSLRQGLGDVTYAPGCAGLREADGGLLEEALKVAGKSSAVILTLGEGARYAGESASLTDIELPECQVELARRVAGTCRPLGIPVICVLVSARPLALPWISENMPVILEAWCPGSEAGNALANILFGQANPSGKLPISFPRNTGQCPLTYMKKSTGRPHQPGNHFTTCYLDSPNDPAYCFGHGLSYSRFAYSDLTLSTDSLGKKGEITLTITVTNESDRDGEEVVQLYVRDHTASVTRPVKELKDFRKVMIPAGEKVQVGFTITERDLRFWNSQMEYVSEPGLFTLYGGTSSDDCLEADFRLEAE